MKKYTRYLWIACTMMTRVAVIIAGFYFIFETFDEQVEIKLLKYALMILFVLFYIINPKVVEQIMETVKKENDHERY